MVAAIAPRLLGPLDRPPVPLHAIDERAGVERTGGERRAFASGAMRKVVGREAELKRRIPRPAMDIARLSPTLMGNLLYVPGSS
jgi:hypothetical protein